VAAPIPLDAPVITAVPLTASRLWNRAGRVYRCRMSAESTRNPLLALEKVTLRGPRVRLEPLDAERHRAGLEAAIADGDLSSLWVTTVPRPDQMDELFAAAAAAFAAGVELPFATVDAEADRIVGSTRFMAIEPTHRRVEIGSTFLAASCQRTHVNTEAKLLMLTHAFDTWKVNRVELLTDKLNERSRAAIARIGGRPEGTLRAHRVMPDGRIRDSAIYSITQPEWPGVQAALTDRLRRS
jgi:N-acetyltransferase